MNFIKSFFIFYFLYFVDILCSAVVGKVSWIPTRTQNAAIGQPEHSTNKPSVPQEKLSFLTKIEEIIHHEKNVNLSFVAQHRDEVELKSLFNAQNHSLSRTNYNNSSIRNKNNIYFRNKERNSLTFNRTSTAMKELLFVNLSATCQFSRSRQFGRLNHSLPSLLICNLLKKLKNELNPNTKNSFLNPLLSRRIRRSAESDGFHSDGLFHNSLEHGLPEKNGIPGYYSSSGGKVLRVTPGKIRAVCPGKTDEFSIIENDMDIFLDRPPITRLYAKKSKLYIAMSRNYSLYTTSNRSDPNTNFKHDYKAMLYDAFISIPHQSYLAFTRNGKPAEKKIASPDAIYKVAQFLAANLALEPYNLVIETSELHDGSASTVDSKRKRIKDCKSVVKVATTAATTKKSVRPATATSQAPTSPRSLKKKRRCRRKNGKNKRCKRRKTKNKCKKKLRTKCKNRDRKRKERKSKVRAKRHRRSISDFRIYSQNISNQSTLKNKSFLNKLISLKNKSSS